jgi:hypothetical protein
MFIRLKQIEPIPDPDSLLCLAQEEKGEETTVNDARVVPKKATKEKDAGVGNYDAVGGKDPNNPFISNYPFGPPEGEEYTE